ncbi:Protein BNI4 [Talaromyces islandicus]|uniref:Protein BNI4 n=1 Tax=Talaromyces islandicus TaxID=28573 RepID=A0A0U1M2G1_TALIS|nr:Protein BNI4 [Talaromyces islandicus]
MAALVQTIPQQNGTVTLLQTRPASASDHSSFISPSHVTQPQYTRGHAMSFSSYNGVNTSGPNRNSVAPYAFTSTPGLVTAAGNAPQRQSQTHPESLYSPALTQNGAPQHLSHFAAGSVSSSSTSSNSSSRPSHVSQDDSILSSRRRQADPAPRPLSTVNLPSQSPFLNLSSPATAPTPSTSSKPSPDRYRRGKRSQDTTAQPAVAIPTRSSSYDPTAITTISQPPRPTLAGHVRVPSADDTRIEKPANPEIAKRYRRRSWASIDAAGAHAQETPSPSLFSPLPELKFDNEPARPPSSHSQKNSSSESPHSDHKGSASVLHNPSPLSNQITPETPTSPPLKTSPELVHSPAAQRLADISKMSGKKPSKSRLRRAFSFGSAAELRKVSAQNSMGKLDIDHEPTGEELDPEQAAIAAQQEANGLGNSIYSHQLGSTDNLSISSTASSASIMLRKMGRGMKKSTRSLVGLFRPKSISNMQTDSVAVQPTAQVSVVNIEAERKMVVANPDPHDQSGGGTVFPKIQTTKTQVPLLSEHASNDANNARKSIVGGERERAEVLAAVKKGILKRSGSSSPIVKPMEPNRSYVADSPNSSAPSTPDEQSHRLGHRRTDTVKIEGEDYFLQPGKLTSDSKSAPGTPQPVVSKSIVFSPRIQFHETWPSGEYDRRGEIATCNKLTPLLAQQIKEELNTFKMEMEVHETSKVYTHFL